MRHRPSGQKPWRDESRLREAYVQRKLSTSDIAMMWDTTAPTVSRWLDKHGIEARSPSEALKLKAAKQPNGNLRPADSYEGGDG